MSKFNLVDGVIKEPLGGAHNAPEDMAKTLKKEIKKHLAELSGMSADDRIEKRIEKFSSMGVFND